MNSELYNELCEIAGSDNVRLNEELKKHVTFRVGGVADYYIIPHSVDEIRRVIMTCKNYDIPFFVIGNGSNLLVGDRGYRGVIIQICNNFNNITVSSDGRITAMSGALLSAVGRIACDNNLAGFEFATGIPGTVGGAVCMNAGAYGGEIKDCLVRVRAVDEEGNIMTFTPEELELSYRHSIIPERGYTILEAEFRLDQGNQDEIMELIKDYAYKRKSKQPLEYPSAGSTFKRPEGYFAGKLIMDAGLSGYKVGGACVSEKHCGFVINSGDATALDVLNVIKDVQKIVKEQYGVMLEPEVKMIGEF